MYEKFYGLKLKPFGVSPDPEFLFMGRHHRRALTLLQYAIHEVAGFALVTGEIGCGKTTMVRYFLDRPGSGLRVGCISNTHAGMGALLPWIIESMGWETSADPANILYRQFVSQARKEYEAGRRLLLVIDEAQNLSVSQLEELRVLSNLNAGKQMLLQVILVGQPELRVTLNSPQLRQFAQRIVTDYHVGAMHAGETQDYVRHRLKVAGGSPDLITAEAACLAHEASAGVPRVINILCDSALLYGYSEQRASIDAEIMSMVLDDRVGSVLPLRTPPAIPSLAQSITEPARAG